MNPNKLISTTWTFGYDSADKKLPPITVFLKFYGGLLVSEHARLNYTREAAQSLVDYLNGRTRA